MRTASAEDTEALGRAVGAVLRPGDVVLLHGPLGAGKTVFVRGAAHALGVRARVRSPTFVFVNLYPGDTPIVHADLFRVPDGQGAELGLEDLAGPEAVTFVEWAERARARFPDDAVAVELTPDADESSMRTITLRASGPRGACVLAALANAEHA